MRIQHLAILIIVGFLSGIGGAYTFQQFSAQSSGSALPMAHQSQAYLPEATLAHYSETHNTRRSLAENDFALASAKSTPSVVYIKTVSEKEYDRMSWMEMFFEGRTTQQAVSSGSGVIFTADGYVVTNHHVIENATQIEVVHGKYSYDARVVGIDPSTDLAVLKVEANELPAIAVGSSSDLQVGEWVLAVGNPFNLTSTVTAGIVSAKGREINILKSKFPIESFIQTDAAINPGNSGGALVDQQGQLIGINTAILSQTGSYAGYGFAVPVDIVKKVIGDIIQYGEVQKAFFGAEVVDMTREIADQLNTDDLSGVVVSSVRPDGSASQAGLQPGDVILKINDNTIRSHSDFEELVSYYSPGDQLTVAYRRKNRDKSTKVQLTNREGTTELLQRDVFDSNALGAELEAVSRVEAELLDIKAGVKVTQIGSGLLQRLGIEEGFVVTAINKRTIHRPEELEDILSKVRGNVRIEGVNKEGVKGYYSYYF